MINGDEIKYETFELAADAYEWLEENGFVQRMTDPREYDHPDGRTAALILPECEAGDQETTVRINLYRLKNKLRTSYR